MASLGCKQNTCEAEAARQRFLSAGYRSVDFGEPAEVYLVYTCTVTSRADYRSRNLLRRAARTAPPGARVVACGCLAVTDPDELAAVEGVTDVLPGPAPNILALLGLGSADRGRSNWPTYHSSFAGHTRAFLSVQDGCDGACSYCKVRLARGRARSRPAEDAKRSLEALTAAGHREVVLTGIHLGAWGRERGDGLASLLAELLNVEGLERLRLSSIEPLELDDALLELIAASRGSLAPHLHVPLQSGSDSVLRRMNRGYTAAEALGRITRARELIPGLGLGLDVLVGFPGESDDDFAATVRAVEESGAGYLHVFAYSPRAGTPAAGYPHQVPDEVKSRRSRELRRLSTERARAFGSTSLGRILYVLVERRPPNARGRRVGVSGEYLRCELVDCPPEAVGRIVEAQALELLGPPPGRPTAGPARLLCRTL